MVCPKFETEFLGKKPGGLQKKKKKVFTEIGSDFSAKIGKSNNFSAQKQVVSKKKKKKRSTPKLSLIFRPKSEIQTLFHTESRHLHHNFGTQFPLGGGCFQFFTKNRPKKQQKRAILHTSQANGRGSSPPRLRYWFGSMLKKNNFFPY